MKSYQQSREVECSPLVAEHATTYPDLHTNGRKTAFRARRVIGITCLAVGVVCVLMTLFVASMPHLTPYRMETIPIELEGKSYSRLEKETDHASVEEGCEATVIRK